MFENEFLEPTLYPIRIDNDMFEQINHNRFKCVLESDYNSLNNLKQADSEFQSIDIRRKIEITYYSGKMLELYIYRFHILYNGVISYMRENCEI